MNQRANNKFALSAQNSPQKVCEPSIPDSSFKEMPSIGGHFALAEADFIYQCAVAPAAPIPVSERICCASYPARSIRARGLRSSIENSQIPTKPAVIENKAGEA